MRTSAYLKASLAASLALLACAGEPSHTAGLDASSVAPAAARSSEALDILGRQFGALDPSARTASFVRDGAALTATFERAAHESIPAKHVVTTRLPLFADDAIELSVPGASLRVSLRGAAHVAARPGEGVVQYPSAKGSSIWMHVPSPRGFEELWVFETPTTHEIRYSIATKGIAGFRQVTDTLEMLDASGDPRLRVSAPYLRDAHGTRRDAAMTLEGCAVDHSSALPWGRPVVPPGADTCEVVVRWSDDGLTYPIVLDPAWTSVTTLLHSRITPFATATTVGGTACAGGCVVVAGGSHNGAYISGTDVFNIATLSWADGGVFGAFNATTGADLGGGTVVVSDAGANSAYYSATTGTWTSLPALTDGGSARALVGLPGYGAMLAGGTSAAVFVLPSASLSGGWNAATAMPDVLGGPAFAYQKATSPLEIAVCVIYGKTVDCADLTAPFTTIAWGSYTAPTYETATYHAQVGSTAYVGTNGSGPFDTIDLSLVPKTPCGSSACSPISASTITFAHLSPTAQAVFGAAGSGAAARLMVTGGANPRSLPGGASIYTGVSSALITSIAAASFQTSTMNAARFGHAHVVLPDGRAMLVGGLKTRATDTSGTITDTAATDDEIFTPPAKGGACTVSAECTGTLQCVEGVCCDTSGGSSASCGGLCESCLVPGSVGTCTPIPASGNPYAGHGTCPAPAGGPCGYLCNGSNRAACVLQAASVSCQASTCTGATLTPTSYCDGAGSCRVAAPGACSNDLKCDAAGDACLSSCASSADCVAGYRCDTTKGQCVSTGGAGSTCVLTSDCKAGLGLTCVDGVCCTSASCPSGQSCAAGAGVCKIPSGGACSAGTAASCATGICAPDGVCCDKPCTGQCEECNSAASPGTCTPRGYLKQPVGGRTACGGSGACQASCDGVTRTSCGPYPTKTQICAAASCASSVATAISYCDGAGSCVSGASTNCTPYVCSGTACGTSCATGTDCGSGYHCDITSSTCKTNGALGSACGLGSDCLSSHCVDGVCCSSASCAAGLRCDASGTGVCAKPLSATCSTDTECGSGHCADGVCCDTPCTGSCEACTLIGHKGTCTPVPSGTQPVAPRAACAGSGACQATCDGTTRGSCGPKPGGSTVCAAPSCTGSSLTGSSFCDGLGTCNAPAPSSCAPYKCASTSACGLTCATTADCATGYACKSGACVTTGALGTVCDDPTQCKSGFCTPTGASGTSVCCSVASCPTGKSCADATSPTPGACVAPNGGTCATGADCSSGNCVDGVCCDTLCTGTCEACDVAGAVGKCNAINGAPHGKTRTPCATSSDLCSQLTCDGSKDRTKCVGFTHGPETVCSSTCSGSTLSNAKCDGMGNCGTPHMTTCAAYACNAAGTDCNTKCSTSTDCASGNVCDTSTGQCMPAKGTCSADLTSSVDKASGLSKPCQPYVCDPGSGACRSDCGSTTDCASGYSCDAASSKCTPNGAGSGSKGGCAVSAPTAGFDAGPAALGVVVALAAMARRTRRRFVGPRTDR